MSVTVKDIARIAKVSHTTVLKALHDKPKISNELKERIKQIAKEQNYIVNSKARDLVLGVSHTLGLILTDSDIPMMSIIAEAVEEESRKSGYSVVVAFSKNSGKREEEAIKTMLELHVAGVIIVPSYENSGFIETLNSTGTPFIILGKIDGVNESYITFDDHYAAIMATRYLMHSGPLSLACLCHGEIDRYPFKSWVSGVMDASREDESQNAVVNFFTCSSDPKDGYRAALELLSSENRPSAILSFSDLHVFGVLKAAREMHIGIPEDLSIIALQDNTLLELCEPSVTSVAFPAEKLGITAARYCIESGKKKQMKSKHLLLKPELIVRASTREPLHGNG